MRLKVAKRAASAKKELGELRRAGDIPAVLYSRGKTGENVSVLGGEFGALLRQIKSGCLPTTVFTLVDEAGKERKAILKDIQYKPTTYEVWHLDFEELHDDVSVNVKVPIQCTGSAECAGIKLGGVLRQVIRTLRVNCMPKDIPSEFVLDIRELEIAGTKRLSDIQLPQRVRPLADLKEVAIVIAKR